MGNRTTVVPIWDRKTENWVYASKNEPRVSKAKLSKARVDQPERAPTAPAQDAEDTEMFEDENEDLEDEAVVGEHGDEEQPTKKPINEPRSFTVRRWMPIPSAEAEKLAEPTYLAKRRPGMSSLYGQHGAGIASVQGYVGTISNVVAPTGVAPDPTSTGIDLGDRSGLADTTALLDVPATAPTTPRRVPPPKRKKKKGGPGRKKAVRIEDAGIAADGVGILSADQSAGSDLGENRDVETGAETEEHRDGDETSSESEEEGSEEGEVRTATPMPEEVQHQEVKDQPEHIKDEEEVNQPEHTGDEEMKTEDDLLSGLESVIDQQVEQNVDTQELHPQTPHQVVEEVAQETPQEDVS